MILLIGSNGQLGQEFKKLFNNNNIKYLAVDHKELDISNENEIKKSTNDTEVLTYVDELIKLEN